MHECQGGGGAGRGRRVSPACGSPSRSRSAAAAPTGRGWPPAPATPPTASDRQQAVHQLVGPGPRRGREHPVGRPSNPVPPRTSGHAASTSSTERPASAGPGRALGNDLVAVHPHRGRVVGDADRQVGHRPAERIQRQHRHLAAGAATAASASSSRSTVHNATSAAPSSTTSAPIHHTPNNTAAVCQCAGSSTATRLAGPAPSSSRSRLPVLAAQLARVAADSSMRSPVASS